MIFEGGNPPYGGSPGSVAKKRVLVVCGEPRVLAEIKMGLMRCFDVSIAAARDAAIAALNFYKADAIVIYIGEDGEQAFSLCRDIAAHSEGAPVLMLAESDSERDEASAFKAGAADYSVKRREGRALLSRINLRILASESERRLNAGDAPRRNAASANKESPEAFLSGKTILIAEDVALNQEFIAAMLSDIEGLTLEFVSNGKEAVERAEKNSGLYSLILMDVYMPEMDGLSAARAIRRLAGKASRGIPIIALTASSSEDDITGILDAGMNGYLEKPLDYEKFLSVCAEYCA